MKNIAVIVGTNTDAIDVNNFPKWLEDIPDNIFELSMEKWDKDYYGLSSDVGIAYYLLKKSKNNKNIRVSILNKKHINLETFNKFDYILGLYCPYYLAFDTKSSKEYNRYNNLIKNTKAKFYQPLSLQKFVINKKRYLTELKKHNIPVVDTIYFKVVDNMNINNMLSKITNPIHSLLFNN